MKNVAHKVFHIESDLGRSEHVNKINDYLSEYSSELDTPTIKISNDKSYQKFCKSNPLFNVNPIGYNLDNEQGWRYGEIGIWASNWTAWHNFLNSDKDYLILMEDDIIYTDKFIELLDKYTDQLPDGWDIFHFFSPADQFHKYNSIHNLPDKDVCSAYQDWSCLCYVITKEGARKLIETSSEIRLPLDWHMFRQTHLFNIYTVKPTSEFACDILKTESTFQTKQKRSIINGIL